MIPVPLAEEPPAFDARIRQRGLDAIAELVGEAPTVRRPGPRRTAVATRREEIPPESFPPFWREALDDMLDAYGRLCAYTALYIARGTGTPSVDHVVPKSKSWDRVYEWSNYRLACLRVNARKSDLDLLLDPCTITDGLFALELVAFQVKPAEGASGADVAAVEATVETLGLNARDFCRAREEWATAYREGEITLSFLERVAPFVAGEMRRQGQLLPGDA